MNPAMSSWVALRRRAPIEPGQSVLVLGATGNAGAMAVQVAKRLGGGRVVGAGRDLDRLRALTPAGADVTIQLTDDVKATDDALAAAAAEVDIVIDYLWGRPALRAMIALLTARADRSRAMNWIQIGAVAGPTIELPSVALRSANFRLQGSGQGSVSREVYLAELPSLIHEINSGAIAGQSELDAVGGCRSSMEPGRRPRRAHRAPAADGHHPSRSALNTTRARPGRIAAQRARNAATYTSTGELSTPASYPRRATVDAP